MRTQRILILDNEFPPLGGGTGVINYHVMAELDRLDGVQVDLVTSSRSRQDYEEEPFGARGRIYKVPVDNRNIHHSSNVELLRYTVRGFRQAERLVRRQAYDLCWAYAAVPAGAVALALRLRTGLPYLLITQGPDIPWYERRYFWLYPVLSPLIRLVWRGAAAVTAQSEASRDLIHRTARTLPVRIIHNGVETECFSPSAALQEERGRRRPLTFLCVGRLIERKGQHHLLEAAELLRRRGHAGQFRVALVGTGDGEEALRRQCARLGLEEVVHFDGLVARDEMPARYAGGDVFVLPSYNEGMSVALLEALAAGLPVVVTETGGTSELVSDNGYVVPWADPAALAAVLERFLLDPDLCRRMGRRSHEIAQAFGWQATARAHLDLSDECLAASS